MKIALVLLCEFLAIQGRGKFLMKNRRGAYAPTTLTTLASLIPKELNAEVRIYDEFIEDFDPYTIDADIVGLSFTTPNANHAYRLAEILKYRGITVVFGGYHTSLVPDEAVQFADACVIGFAENSWPMLLIDYSKGQLKKIYQESAIDGFEKLEIHRQDLLKRKKYFLPYTLEFSRSCNNNCNFCVIPCFSGKPMQYRCLGNVVREINQMKGKRVAFLDSSPAENKKYFIKLCDRLKPLNIKWYSAISFKSALQPGLIETMSESGCRGVLLGFETLNQETLNVEGKSFNQVALYKDVIRRLHRNKIYVFATFIFGFEEDTNEVFQNTVDFVNECNIDLAHYGILTPFPGTVLYKTLEEQGRILTKDWSRYDSLHVTFKPKNMTTGELQNGFRKAYLKTHSFTSIMKRMAFSRTRSWINFCGNIALGIYGARILNRVGKEVGL